MDMYGVSTMDGVADIKWLLCIHVVSLLAFCSILYRYNDTSLLVGLDNGCVEVWSLVAPGNELENVNTLDLRHDEMVLCISVTSDGENSSYILSGGGDGRYVQLCIMCLFYGVYITYKLNVAWALVSYALYIIVLIFGDVI